MNLQDFMYDHNQVKYGIVEECKKNDIQWW